MDKITSLPDSIQSHILTFLPVSDAVRTKILSKQWRRLWLPTRYLVLSLMPTNTGFSLTQFANFNDPISPLDTCSQTTKYKLRKGPLSAKSPVDVGVKTAILCHVTDVRLDFRNWYGEEPYSLSQPLFACQTLENLTLRRCSINCSKYLLKSNWPALKELTVESTWLDDELVSNILRCSPKLKNLELNQCYGFKRINADTTGCLRKLVMVQPNQCRYSDRMVVITMPNVECLTLKLRCKVRLINVTSLVDVALDFRSSETNPYFHKGKSIRYSRMNKMMHESIDMLEDRRRVFMDLLNDQHISKDSGLGLGVSRLVSSFEAISSLIRKDLRFSLSLATCKRLELETPLNGWDIPGVLTLLKNSPVLETLTLHLTIKTNHNTKLSSCDKIGDLNPKTYWKKQDSFPKQILRHLKIVTIIGHANRLLGFAQF